MDLIKAIKRGLKILWQVRIKRCSHYSGGVKERFYVMSVTFVGFSQKVRCGGIAGG